MSLSSGLVSQFVGTRVQAERIRSGRTLTEFAQALDISADELAAYEGGAERTPAAVLIEAARELDQPVSCFFEGFNRYLSVPLEHTRGL